MINKGKKVDWKVVPKMVVELDILKENIVSLIARVERKFNG